MQFNEPFSNDWAVNVNELSIAKSVVTSFAEKNLK
jgi:hypothetical protein